MERTIIIIGYWTRGNDGQGDWAARSAFPARLESAGMAALTSTMLGATPDLKKITCEVLGRMYDRQDIKHKPIEPLLVLRDDPDADVQRYANHALNLLGWKPGS